MADEQPPGGGFSLSKRYGPLPAWAWGLLGGAGVYAGYRFWQNRQSQASAGTTAAAAGTNGQAIDYAPQISTLQAEIEQLQGEKSVPGPAGPQGKQGPPGTTPEKGSGGTVTVPNVVGQRVAFALDRLESAGLKGRPTRPLRNPSREYTVTGQAPRAGSKVPRGTLVILTIRAISPSRRRRVPSTGQTTPGRSGPRPRPRRPAPRRRA